MLPYGNSWAVLLTSCFASILFAAPLYGDSPDCADSYECQFFHTIRPIEYDVSLKLFIPLDGTNIRRERVFTFEGEVSVDFEVTRRTSNLSFHASNLQFKSVKVACGEGVHFSDAIFTVDSSSVNVHLAEELINGSRCSIEYSYTGSISESEDGGLRKEFASFSGGADRWIVYTNYKLLTAMPRTLFPCIDEPAYKAKFSLKLIYPSGMAAIASTPLKNTVQIGYGWTYSVFEKTDKIPSFGVTFAVGHFKKIASKITPKRTVNTWIPDGVKSSVHTDMAAIAEYIDQLENYLDVNYPSSKLDIVGLPLYYNTNSSCSSLQTPTSGILFVDHESVDSLEAVGKAIARGWFGVLMSPRWWNDGFLSEGFATYFYAIGAHLTLHSKPEDMEHLFPGKILLLDLLFTTAPIKQSPVITSETWCFTREMGIKSALILQMVQRIIGEDNFQRVIRKFLKAHVYDVATHDDLFQLFTESMREAGSKDWCGHPLSSKAFLFPWLTQLGYPKVLLHSQGGDRGVALSQTLLEKKESISTWPIPIFLEKQPLKWIPPGNNECEVSPSLILNGTERQFLRPSSLSSSIFVYDDYERARIIRMLPRNSVPSLSEADRLAFTIHHLHRDWRFRFKLLAVNNTDTIKVFTKIAETARSGEILDMMEGVFTTLRSMFLDTQYHILWKEFGKLLFGRRFDNNSLTKNMNSSALSVISPVLGYAIEFDVNDVRLQSFELFKTAYEQCVSNGIAECKQLPLEPTLMSDILCGAVKYNSSYVFNRLLEHTRRFRLMFPNSFHEQENLYYGLSCVEDEAMLEEYLRDVVQILSGSNKPPRLSYQLMHRLRKNQRASDVIASYVSKNKLEIIDRSLLGLYGNTMVANWNSPERYDQLTKMEVSFTNLVVDTDLLDQVEFDFLLMKRMIRRNEEERNLHLEPIASFFHQYLHDEV